ncbi:MAG: recombination mediator RecR [Actinomycetota bacterium]|nr:recombination mediator RecR [Actinomycetota bacterium]MEC7607500.1 recombination mediator RecR [Actinomycetota bacterium]MEC8120112.1 recombination mediator RecR [Actinomycetota bacterium]MEC8365317.1 recombination mediator RecR [Actinomycetota bacterium]MEE3015456.1 recombination mediator RecR [Actinomycetota bacterium]|tara:strand:+ start:66 stop:677 length:612 start_codon:yes stop_codon:yes gene_type:complete
MSIYTPALQKLIDELGKLPGVGPKSAQRIAFHLIKIPEQEALSLADAIQQAKQKVRFCETCFNMSDEAICEICSDSQRDSSLVCVVEEPRDIVALERTREYKGLYHVLQGAINPIDGIGPEQLKIRELLERLKGNTVVEVILCTNPNIEGEATAMYLAKLIEPLGIQVSRIASGLPVGGDLEYADELTLGRALEGRRNISGDE